MQINVASLEETEAHMFTCLVAEGAGLSVVVYIAAT